MFWMMRELHNGQWISSGMFYSIESMLDWFRYHSQSKYQYKVWVDWTVE